MSPEDLQCAHFCREGNWPDSGFHWRADRIPITYKIYASMIGDRMCTPDEQALLHLISTFSSKWFDEATHPSQYFKPKKPTRRGRRNRSDKIGVFREQFQRTVVSDISKAFGLERCGLLLPVVGKEKLWRLAAEQGFPKSVANRKTYRLGLGLSGRVLAGETIKSSDIMSDPRRSGHHGEAWITPEDRPEPGARSRSFIGVPIWAQVADLHRQTLGAIIGIRPENFSEYEAAAMLVVSEFVSHGFSGLSLYEERINADRRNVELRRIWEVGLPENQVFSMTLKLLQQIMPFKRMLLALVNDEHTHIVGRAVTGFRPGLIDDTRRTLFHEPPPNPSEEDILAWFVREHRTFPETVPRDNVHVHTITALRHQIENDLLLIPLVDGDNQVQGTILAELPDMADPDTKFVPSIGELERFSLHAKQIADYVADRRIRVAASRKLSLLAGVCSLARRQGTAAGERVTLLLRYVCGELQIRRAAIMGFDKRSDLLKCEAVVGCEVNSSRRYGTQIAWASHAAPTLAERAIISGGTSIGAVLDGFPFAGLTQDDPAGDSAAIAVPLGGKGACVGALVAEIGEGINARAVESQLMEVTGVIADVLHLRNFHIEFERLRRKADAQHSFAYRMSVLGTSEQAVPATLHQIVETHRDAFESVLQDVSEALASHLTELFIAEHPIKLDHERQIPVSDFDTEFSKIVSHCRVTNAGVADDKRRESKNSAEGGLTASVLQTMSRQMSPDVPHDDIWSGSVREFKADQPRCWLGIPLVAQMGEAEYCWGVLASTRERESCADSAFYDQDDLILAQSFADRLAALFCQLSQARSFKKRTKSFLRRFDHDLPNLVDHIEQLSHEFVTTAAGSGQVALGEKLTACTGALKACVSSLLSAYYTPNESRSEFPPISVSRIEKRLTEMASLCSIGSGVSLNVFDEYSDSHDCLADEDALLYALYILVHNAYRSCVEKRQRADLDEFDYKVDVLFTKTAEATEDVRVVVRDNGQGFHPQMNPKIVREGDSFWNTKGLGVGRTIVSTLVSSMGGREFSSRNLEADNSGAEVSFYLPSEQKANHDDYSANG